MLSKQREPVYIFALFEPQIYYFSNRKADHEVSPRDSVIIIYGSISTVDCLCVIIKAEVMRNIVTECSNYLKFTCNARGSSRAHDTHRI